jgi:hypothetical protein
LVPAIADDVAHTIILQRTPTFFRTARNVVPNAKSPVPKFVDLVLPIMEAKRHEPVNSAYRLNDHIRLMSTPATRSIIFCRYPTRPR